MIETTIYGRGRGGLTPAKRIAAAYFTKGICATCVPCACDTA